MLHSLFDLLKIVVAIWAIASFVAVILLTAAIRFSKY